MEITFIGHACFRVKGKNHTLVFDPYDPKKTGYKLPELTGDILLVSHDHDDHNYVEGVSGHRLLINSPGEYEVEGTFIYGVETFHDENRGSKRGRNVLYHVEMDEINILYLGDLGHELSQETLNRLPAVDVLLIPVGGIYTIDAKKASRVISSLEPGIVVPMHYQTEKLTGLSKELDPLEKFLDEMGVENVKKIDKLKVRKSDIPEETEVIVINPTA